MRCNCIEDLEHFVDRLVERGSPRGQSDAFAAVEPCGPQVDRRLHLPDRNSRIKGQVGELARVIRGGSADNHDRVNEGTQLFESRLSVRGRLADAC